MGKADFKMMTSDEEGVFWATIPNSFTWSTNNRTPLNHFCDSRRFHWIEEKHHIVPIHLAFFYGRRRPCTSLSSTCDSYLTSTFVMKVINIGKFTPSELAIHQFGGFATPSMRSIQWMRVDVFREVFPLITIMKVASNCRCELVPALHSFMREFHREWQASLLYALRNRNFLGKVHPPSPNSWTFCFSHPRAANNVQLSEWYIALSESYHIWMYTNAFHCQRNWSFD